MNQIITKTTKMEELSEYKKLLLANSPEQFLKLLESLSDSEVEALKYDLEWQGRKKQQLPPGDWFAWIVKPGRGFGKTWLGGKVTNQKARTVERIALIGDNTGEVREVMIDAGFRLIGPT
jgi:phage terminase large subunit-like protein